MVTKKAKLNQPRFNIFEGARRIVKLAALIAVIIVISDNWERSYYAPAFAHYYKTAPNEAPYLMESRHYTCDYSDIEKEFTRTIGDEDYRVVICFKSADFSNGKLIPYKQVGEKWLGNVKYNPEVEKYVQDFLSKWNIYRKSSSDRVVIYYDEMDEYNSELEKLDKQIKANLYSERLERVWKAAENIALTLIIMFVGSAVLGWIVRGFFNIPRGQDFRNQS